MNLKPFLIASILTVLTACSSQPTQPTTKAPAAAVAAPAATAPLATNGPAAAAALQVASTDGNGPPPVNRALISAGYKPTTIQGAVFYCRTVDVTNTAFKKKVCLNEAQIAAEEKKAQEMRREMLRMQPNPGCFGPTCADP
jgi:hypothetical protein